MKMGAREGAHFMIARGGHNAFVNPDRARLTGVIGAKLCPNPVRPGRRKSRTRRCQCFYFDGFQEGVHTCAQVGAINVRTRGVFGFLAHRRA
jgi:hypothetical protein